MRDGHVVVELSTAQHELFLPCGASAQDVLRVVRQHGHYQKVEFLCRGLSDENAFVALGIWFVRIDWRGFQYHSILVSFQDGGDLGAGLEFHPFRFKVGRPIFVEFVELRKRDHGWQVG